MMNSKDYVASLARGIEVIRAFTAPQDEEHSTLSHRIGPTDALTLSQVAERVGVARAVVRRVSSRNICECELIVQKQMRM